MRYEAGQCDGCHGEDGARQRAPSTVPPLLHGSLLSCHESLVDPTCIVRCDVPARRTPAGAEIHPQASPSRVSCTHGLLVQPPASAGDSSRSESRALNSESGYPRLELPQESSREPWRPSFSCRISSRVTRRCSVVARRKCPFQREVFRLPAWQQVVVPVAGRSGRGRHSCDRRRPRRRPPCRCRARRHHGRRSRWRLPFLTMV